MTRRLAKLIMMLIFSLMMFIVVDSETAKACDKTPEQIFNESIDAECKKYKCFCKICPKDKKKEKESIKKDK